MKKGSFCVDLDDTISDTAPEILKYAIKYDIEDLGNSGTLTPINNCDDYFYFAYMLGWGRNEVKSFFDKYYLEFLEAVSLKDGALDILYKMRDLGTQIHVVTARREKENNIVEKITHDWLISKRVPFDYLVVNCIEKANYVREVNGIYFLDDSIKNCISVKNETLANSFLMKTRHNEESAINTGIQRVTWDEFYDNVKVLRRK